MSDTCRMPALDPSALDEEQRAAADRITSGPRGELVGPFTVLLRTPALMDRVQEVGAHLRYGKVLESRLFELGVLVVARHWDQPFEWAHHAPLALAEGLDPDVVEAVGRGLEPPTDDSDVLAVWRVVTQLLATGQVDDAAYADAVQALGEPALVELVVTTGYYTTLAMVMNVARTPTQPGPVLPARDGRAA
jgi:4-carboxymuconolactone decarboxylase